MYCNDDSIKNYLSVIGGCEKISFDNFTKHFGEVVAVKTAMNSFVFFRATQGAEVNTFIVNNAFDVYISPHNQVFSFSQTNNDRAYSAITADADIYVIKDLDKFMAPLVEKDKNFTINDIV